MNMSLIKKMGLLLAALLVAGCASVPTFENMGFMGRGISPTDSNPVFQRGQEVWVRGDVKNLQAGSDGQIDTELLCTVDGKKVVNPPPPTVAKFPKATERTGLAVDQLWAVPMDAEDGQYTLTVTAKDKVSGKESKLEIPFQVQGAVGP